MSIEDIEKFLTTKLTDKESVVKISFKKRDPVYGMFIKNNDYMDLKSKNFWRVVTRTNVDEWLRSKNMNLPKIFNGSEFTRLTVQTEVVS